MKILSISISKRERMMKSKKQNLLLKKKMKLLRNLNGFDVDAPISVLALASLRQEVAIYLKVNVYTDESPVFEDQEEDEDYDSIFDEEHDSAPERDEEEDSIFDETPC